MTRTILSFILPTFLLLSCSHKSEQRAETKIAANQKIDACCEGDMACKLTTPEMQLRRETVIASLKKQVQEKKELEHGFAFRFPGHDAMLDELTEFIKTERECCDFFTFNLSISGDKSAAWLEMSGADGVKDFVTAELGM
jgi:hypothetical protein